MPISGCPNSSSHLVRGFTLIEILVVLFIVSIMTGIAIVNLPGFTQTGDFDTETNRLKVVLEMLREQALVQANEYGLSPGRKGYQFYVYDEMNQVWELLQEAPFAARRLPANIHISVRVEGRNLQVGEGDSPPILILSSGEITTFELTMESDVDNDLQRTLESDGYGAIVWRGEDEL